MPRDNPDRPALIERVERALVLLAYFIELDGEVHLPMYEKLESELEELRAREAARERARTLLNRHANLRRPEVVAVLPPAPWSAPLHDSLAHGGARADHTNHVARQTN